MSLASDRDALNCISSEAGLTGSEVRTAPANFRSISGVAILLPVSKGVGLWPQSCASLSGPLCVVRHQPSGEYSWFLPAGAGAVPCADGAIPGVLCELSSQPPSPSVLAWLSRPSLMLQGGLSSAVSRLLLALTPVPQLLNLVSRRLAVTVLDPRAA